MAIEIYEIQILIILLLPFQGYFKKMKT